MMWSNLCCILMTDHRYKRRRELTSPSSAKDVFRRYTELGMQVALTVAITDYHAAAAKVFSPLIQRNSEPST